MKDMPQANAPEQFNHPAQCFLPKGYFDQILARIERKEREEGDQKNTKLVTASPKTIILEIEKWESSRFG
jgi:hypothetical protein